METAAPPANAESNIRWDVDSAAVLVIDAQNDFCHSDGAHARRGQDVARLQAPLRRLRSFLVQARHMRVPVVFVQNVHHEDDDSVAWRHRHLDQTRPQVCLADTWGADFCFVRPEPDDVVVQKNRYSAFAGTSMEQMLERLDRRSLLFTGFTTSVCVESSLREAVCRDYLATLVEDCCGDYTPEAHDRAVAGISSGFGLVTRRATIASAWAQWSPPSAPQARP